MRLLKYIFLILVLASCTSNYHKEDFSNKSFESKNGGMMGSYILKFENDSIFTFTQRDGFLYTKGEWSITKSSDYITLVSSNSIKRFGKNDTIVHYKLLDNGIKIIAKNRLEYKGIMLRRTPLGMNNH